MATDLYQAPASTFRHKANMGFICVFVQMKTLVKGCNHDGLQGRKRQMGGCGYGPLICVGLIHWLGSNFEGMRLCNRRGWWASCHEHAAKESPWASHSTRYLWLLPSVDAVGPFGPEDTKTRSSRPEFPKLDISTTLSVISSQGSKQGKGKQKPLVQHFRAQQKLDIYFSTDNDFSTAAIFCCMWRNSSWIKFLWWWTT